jgi:NAD(P)-dependent dehydrogenase (short-subunit alcohol dehydrogenase family)
MTNNNTEGVNLHGRTAVITGANAGLGRVSALALARVGASVVMACRNQARGEAARDAIIAESGNQDVRLVQLDLASFDSVRRAADDIRESVPRVDILMNNAGYLPGSRELSPIGVELSFFVNHLSPFLLTNLLLPAVEAAPEGRIINVSSDIHKIVKIPWDDLACARRYGPYYAYSIGKLGNVMFTHELVRRFTERGVAHITANSLHPGYIASEFGDDTHWWLSALIKLVRPLLLTPEQGARTQIHMAMSPSVKGVTGQYFKGCRVNRASRYSHDDRLCRRLWELSSELTKLES